MDFVQAVPHGRQLSDPHRHPGKKAASELPSGPTEPAKPEGNPNSTARESDLYIEAVTKLINARKVYPRMAIEREEEGRVVVAVTIDREGHLIESIVEEKAPFDSLNRAALETVKAVGDFPPIPSEVADPVHLHIPLVFKIER